MRSELKGTLTGQMGDKEQLKRAAREAKLLERVEPAPSETQSIRSIQRGLLNDRKDLMYSQYNQFVKDRQRLNQASRENDFNFVKGAVDKERAQIQNERQKAQRMASDLNSQLQEQMKRANQKRKQERNEKLQEKVVLKPEMHDFVQCGKCDKLYDKVY